jgi:hypothetical protein
VIDHLLDLEERGWQALSSVESIAFCDEWLADDAVVIVPGMDIHRATFLEAVAHTNNRGQAIASKNHASSSCLMTRRR